MQTLDFLRVLGAGFSLLFALVRFCEFVWDYLPARRKAQFLWWLTGILQDAEYQAIDVRLWCESQWYRWHTEAQQDEAARRNVSHPEPTASPQDAAPAAASPRR